MSEKLNIVLNPDGTITRLLVYPKAPASCDDLTQPALSRDITIDQSKSTWVRLYLPREALDNSIAKFPVVIYFHGGGMVILNADTEVIHQFCANLAAETRSIVGSVDYRLAPEHRLPAAYDDALDALRWLGGTDDKWVRDHADLSRCFFMGGSGGGNVSYGAGLRAAAAEKEREAEFGAAKLQGLILQQPFFGGAQRTANELRLEHDSALPLCTADLLWELALPIGANREHEFCDPMVGDGATTVAKKGWRVLISACYDDPLFDRQAELAKILDRKGVDVVSHFGPGNHGSDQFDPSLVKLLFVAVKKFIYA